LVHVFLCHSIYVILSSFERYLLDAPPNNGYITRTVRIADIECDFGIPENVSVLLAPFKGIDDDSVAVVVNPCLGDLRRPVWHQGSKVRVGLRFDKLPYRFRKWLHCVLSACPWLIGKAVDFGLFRSCAKGKAIRYASVADPSGPAENKLGINTVRLAGPDPGYLWSVRAFNSLCGQKEFLVSQDLDRFVWFLAWVASWSSGPPWTAEWCALSNQEIGCHQ